MTTTGTAAPPPARLPGTPAQRLGRAAADCLTITRRNLIRAVRDPAEPLIGVIMPIVVMLLFGSVFGSVLVVPGGGNVYEFLMPGFFAMAMLNGVAATATGMAIDSGREVMGRFRSMPMAPSALLTGRAAADLLRAVVELALLVLVGLLVGWRWNGGIGGALLALALLLLFRLALTWVGVYLGLVARDPEVTGVLVWPVVFPITVISTTYLPPALMSDALGAIAEWNPVSAVVNATRELFANPGVGGDSWTVEHAALMAVAWSLLILAVFVPLSIRRYQRLSR
ncbi:MAG: ABC transporter permease [Nocardiopsaceae bacterium]|nr:ABC transporter permease [Nocardiopsaceae bacterium]